MAYELHFTRDGMTAIGQVDDFGHMEIDPKILIEFAIAGGWSVRREPRISVWKEDGSPKSFDEIRAEAESLVPASSDRGTA